MIAVALRSGGVSAAGNYGAISCRVTFRNLWRGVYVLWEVQKKVVEGVVVVLCFSLGETIHNSGKVGDLTIATSPRHVVTFAMS